MRNPFPKSHLPVGRPAGARVSEGAGPQTGGRLPASAGTHPRKCAEAASRTRGQACEGQQKKSTTFSRHFDPEGVKVWGLLLVLPSRTMEDHDGWKTLQGFRKVKQEFGNPVSLLRGRLTHPRRRTYPRPPALASAGSSC